MTEDTLLQPLSDLDFLRIIHQFQWSTTNQLCSYIGYNKRSIYRRIHKMKPYLHLIQDSPPRYIYGLNRKGSLLLEISYMEIPDELQKVYTVLFRNDIWKWCGYPNWKWKSRLLPASEGIPLIPDAYWYHKRHLYIVEMDTTENRHRTLRNMRRYQGIVKQAEKLGTPIPHVYYFTTDAGRSAWLEESLGENLFWLHCIHQIPGEGRLQ